VCGVEGEHKYHDTMNLRPIIVDIMKNFDTNFQTFEEQFIKVRDARIIDYKNKIYSDIAEFFNKIHEITDQLHEAKRGEVDEIFRKLKVDDLSDMDKYT
jgi:D-alanine-D-alanine ligase-like ATP-grasp enzyme